MEILVILALIYGFVLLMTLIGKESEKRNRERRRLQRQAALKSQRAHNRELGQRLRSNDYQTGDEVEQPSGTARNKTPGPVIPNNVDFPTSSQSKKEAPLLQKVDWDRVHLKLSLLPFIGVLIPSYIIDTGRLQIRSAYHDFDSLNRNSVTGFRKIDSGDSSRFPYELMDFGAFSYGWKPFGSSQRNTPAKLYLVIHSQMRAVKIGITSLSSSTDRIEQHTQRGWKLVDSWSVASLVIARKIERAIITWWRLEVGADVALAVDEMPQGGHTETSSLNLVDVEQTRNRIGRLIADDGDEQILDLNFNDLLVGSIVLGQSSVIATRLWKPNNRNQGSAYQHGTSGKALVGNESNQITIEFYAGAYSQQVDSLIPIVGDLLTFRGRVQQLGSEFRITNPWLWFRSTEIRPLRKFNLV